MEEIPEIRAKLGGVSKQRVYQIFKADELRKARAERVQPVETAQKATLEMRKRLGTSRVD